MSGHYPDESLPLCRGDWKELRCQLAVSVPPGRLKTAGWGMRPVSAPGQGERSRVRHSVGLLVPGSSRLRPGSMPVPSRSAAPQPTPPSPVTQSTGLVPHGFPRIRSSLPLHYLVEVIKEWMVVMTAAVALAACSDGRSGTAPTPLASSQAAKPRITPVETVAVQPTLGPIRGVWKNTGVREDPAYMTSVAVSGPRDAWVVGSAADESVGIVKHWDGHRWQSVKPPGKRGENGLAVVAALSSGSVWAFGQDGNAWRRERGGWSHQGRPNGLSLLRAAVVVGPREVWVAGLISDKGQSPLLARWSGTSWTTAPAPFVGEVTSLSVGSGRQLWAMSRGGDDDVPAVARWDGTRWHDVPLPDRLRSQEVTLKRIVAAAPGKAWIAGAVHVQNSDGYEQGFVMYWNGHDWHSLNTPSHDAFQPPQPETYSDFGTIASDGRGGLWLGDEHGRIWHYDGRKWRAEKIPSGSSWRIAADFASVPGSDQAIAVGGKPNAEEDSEGWIWLRHAAAID